MKPTRKNAARASSGRADRTRLTRTGLTELAGAVATPIIEPPAPQLASPIDVPPEGADFCHEIKLDGYRMLVKLADGRVTLFSRRGHSWTERAPDLARALSTLPCRSVVLDGEMVALDEQGRSDFAKLQALLAGPPMGRAGALVYFAFDILYIDGVDVRGVALVDRKTVLRQLLDQAPPTAIDTVRFCDHIVGQGPAFFEQAARMGLEGIVCKRLDAPYRSGRSQSWLKVKSLRRQELIIVGFTEPRGSRGYLGALLVATYGRGELVYRGRVGTGFDETALRMLHRSLAPLRHPQPRMAKAPTGRDARDVHWVRPHLVAEIAFSKLTRDGLLRHARYLGLREDKPANEVHFDSDLDTDLDDPGVR
jgi:bifunctional non-homologous end joining protein LigD